MSVCVEVRRTCFEIFNMRWVGLQMENYDRKTDQEQKIQVMKHDRKPKTLNSIIYSAGRVLSVSMLLRI
jgi:hypothetical protein